MLWPEAVTEVIRTIETDRFLTDAQERDIICNKASDVLRLKRP